MTDTASLDKLESIVGESFVLRRESDLLVYNSDGLPGYRRMPRLAVFPGNREETVEVVRALAEMALRSYRAVRGRGYPAARLPTM